MCVIYGVIKFVLSYLFSIEVNYRQLMSGEDPLSVLLPALGDHNIHVVAKLVKGIPLKVSKIHSNKF